MLFYIQYCLLTKPCISPHSKPHSSIFSISQHTLLGEENRLTISHAMPVDPNFSSIKRWAWAESVFPNVRFIQDITFVNP